MAGPPADAEVGKALRLSPKKLALVALAVEADALTRVYSTGGDDESSIMDELADDGARPCEEALDKADRAGRVRDFLAMLDDREASIVRMRFGLAPYEPTTWVEIGHKIGVSKAHVCRLANRAMAKLVGAMAGQEAGELAGVRSPARTRRESLPRLPGAMA